MNDLMTTGRASHVLDCSESLVRYYVDRGLLPAIRIDGMRRARLIRTSDVRKFKAARDRKLRKVR